MGLWEGEDGSVEGLILVMAELDYLFGVDSSK